MSRLCKNRFSTAYAVRRLTERDVPQLVGLCGGNPQFYACRAEAAAPETVWQDLQLLPPGKGPEDKYTVGFFDGETLAAVLDLIDGYPAPATAYLGFFMMNKRHQGHGEGSAIIGELCAYLKGEGFTAVRLGIDKGNPQSTHFWEKNGFAALKEIPQEDGVIILAEKVL